MNEPDAGNCTVEPVVEEPKVKVVSSKSNLEEYHQQSETQSKSIAISVDCSKARDSDQLLFQLSISRNSVSGNLNRQNQEDQVNLRRLLFAQGEFGGQETSQVSISDILDWDEIIAATNVTLSDDEVTQNDQGFSLIGRNSDENVEQTSGSLPLQSVVVANNATKQAGRFVSLKGKASGKKMEAISRLITLDEQVDLLKQLVFTIRASNLLKMSAPHAIYGSELKLVDLDKFKNQASKLISSSNHPIAATNTQTQQVSRSTTNQLDNIEDGSPPLSHLLTMHSSISNSSMKGNRQGSNSNNLRGKSSSTTTSDRIHDYEINLTIAAIFATFILSLLTLTLIILVLKGRKKVQNGTVCVIEEQDSTNNDTSSSNNNNNSTNTDIINNNNNNMLQLTDRIRSHQRANVAASESYDMNHFILLMVLFK